MNVFNLLLISCLIICSIFLLISGKSLSKVEKHTEYASFVAPLRTFNEEYCEFGEEDFCLLENAVESHEIIKLNYEKTSTWYELKGVRHEMKNEVHFSAFGNENACRQMKDLSLQKDSGKWIRRITNIICNCDVCYLEEQDGIENQDNCLDKKALELENEWMKLFEENHD